VAREETALVDEVTRGSTVERSEERGSNDATDGKGFDSENVDALLVVSLKIVVCLFTIVLRG
jgi:hypothetical protein